ncbi:unnamed protein product [Ranitomeya imitator]|uniref:Reverse transcriptase domain-containing protein n=1 Tax=Ranitomeya imitator TaxID=111125 RepID=A0ABN9LIB1_9NEOB|nr:unnamed protein product [Ranitomeya imitator]
MGRIGTDFHDAYVASKDPITTSPHNGNSVNDLVLSQMELQVLQRGLSFCPTPSFNDFTLDQELNRFFRSLRLKVHFSGSTILPPSSIGNSMDSVMSDTTLTLKKLNLVQRSAFSPPRVYHPVETYISLVKNDVRQKLMDIQQGRHRIRNNMSRAEREAIDSLRSNKKLVIKPADKGGAVVVMDRQYYVEEIRSQLSDSNTYLQIPHDPTSDITKIICTLSHRFCTLGVIDKKLGDFLVNSYPVCPVLYTLPKIHKDLTCPPGRPIVASTGSLLSPLAMVLEKILSPLLCHIPSYLRDTSHFLSAIRDVGIVPAECYLVTLDVNSLYTNINNTDGIKAVKSFLDDTTEFNLDLKEFCIALLTLILTKNFFLFEDDFFIQLNGTAMGSNVAPPYANIFMADFEGKFVYTHVLFQQFCPLWKRYIDDIFLIWNGDLDSLFSFYDSINKSVDRLTFSIQHDRKSISFLDTLVTINDDRSLSTDLFVKPTDKNSLLLFTSCHPRHIKRSLPRSQYSRVNRIVSDPSLRTVRLNEMTSKFRNRGYPESLLKTSLDNSSSNVPQQPVSRMAFVNTYHPFMPMFHGLIRKHWSLLGLSYPSVPEFQVAPLMCHKKPSNLRNLLVSADVGSSKMVTRQTFLATARTGTFPCLHCRQCSNIIRGDTFTHPRSGKRFPIRGYFSCDSTFVVYLIKCPCGLGYVDMSRDLSPCGVT